MRHRFHAVAYAAVAALASFSFAAPPEGKVAETIKGIYPKGEADVASTFQANGVRVDDVRVTVDGGTVAAQLSENGDLLYYGIPRTSDAVNERAAEAVKNLLKDKPVDVDSYRVVYYLVDFNAGGQAFTMTFNAVGQVFDVVPLAEKKASDAKIGDGVKKKLERLGIDYSNGGTVNAITPHPTIAGYYTVDATGKNGLGQHIVVNEAGQVWETTFDLKRETLPAPIARTLEQFFQKGSITRLARVETQFYQFEQDLGDRKLKVRLHPNGDIGKISASDASVAPEPKKKAKK